MFDADNNRMRLNMEMVKLEEDILDILTRYFMSFNVLSFSVG